MGGTHRYELRRNGTAKVNVPGCALSVTQRNVVLVGAGLARKVVAPRSALVGVRVARGGSETRMFEVRLLFHAEGLPAAIKIYSSLDGEQAAAVATQIAEHLGAVVLGRGR